MRIRTRLTMWYALLLALVVGAVGVFVAVRLRADLTDSIDHTLHEATRQIAVGYEREGAQEFRDSSASLLAGERAASQVVGPDGRVILSWGGPVAQAPLLHRSGFRVTSRPVARHGQRGTVVVAISLASVDRSVHRVEVLLLLALPAALVLVAAGGWLLARRALAPVERMTRTAAAIDAGRLAGRVPSPGTRDEVGQLAQTLNAMLDRIEAGVAEQQRLIADASHELRTPLAAMRSELDVSLRVDDLPSAARDVLESVREEVDALGRTVRNLLTLARVDAGELTVRREPVDLRTVAADAAARLAPVAAAKRVDVQVDGGPALSAGDPVLLGQVVRNLLENAIDFSPEGEVVALATTSANGHVQLTVADAGPGVARDARERVFERFYRADRSRSRRTGGSGLGLAIARELVAAHGGRIWVEAREPRGAVFHVELPAELG